MAWDENKHPRDSIGRFTFKSKLEEFDWIYSSDPKIYEHNTSYGDIIRLPDEQLPYSIGAKWGNYDICMPDGSLAHFVEGSKLQDKEVFAGRGCKTQIRDRYELSRDYPGSHPDMWQKVKAKAQIVLHNGEVLAAEIHWYEEPTIGKVEFKYKKDL